MDVREGHTAGDAFLCFDKDAFQSYGFKKSANAPVSEEAMTAVNAALTDLIAKAPVLGNAKLVHWYSSGISEEEDLLPILLEGGWDDGVDSEPDDEEGKICPSGRRRSSDFLHREMGLGRSDSRQILHHAPVWGQRADDGTPLAGGKL
ncbi:MAG: type I-C CRISPR-associated protein Cas8c/Csd1 [Oscillospiraceae bacterium]